VIRVRAVIDLVHVIWLRAGTANTTREAATYARQIKKKPPTPKSSSSSPGPKADVAPAPPAAPDELQHLKDELQRVNQEISKLARLTRPGSDAARHSQLPEKQELLVQKIDLERKLRAVKKA
jgi:type IV secretory pathway VirB10-like protein